MVLYPTTSDYKRSSNTIGQNMVNYSVLGNNASIYRPLYNGNIAAWATNTKNAGLLTSTNYDAQLRTFFYDKLNRLKNAFTANRNNANPSNFVQNGTNTEEFSYFPDGNLKKLSRRNSASTYVDQFTYHYDEPVAADYTSKGFLYPAFPTNLYVKNSRLKHVDDLVSNTVSTTDIDDQTAGNYNYDPSGNLSNDNSQNEAYTWTFDGKLLRVSRFVGQASAYEITYTYDATGNRVSKTVLSAGPTGAKTTTTYYIRDASGNIMAMYEGQVTNNPQGNSSILKLTELPIYGSSRVGAYKPNETMVDGGELPPPRLPDAETMLQDFDGTNQAPVGTYSTVNITAANYVANPLPNSAINTSATSLRFARTWWADEVTFNLPATTYDITKPIRIDVRTLATTESQQLVVLLAANPGSIWWGMENDVDAKVIAKYTATIAPNGGEWQTITLQNPTVYTNHTKTWNTYLTVADAQKLLVYLAPPASGDVAGQYIWLDNLRQVSPPDPDEQVRLTQPRTYYRKIALREYELTDHLGNVRVVIGDYRKATLTANALSSQEVPLLSLVDHYAFGSTMRSYNPNESRFGFNGQMRDDDIAGTGNHNTALFWEYDTRLGRRWNQDPKPNPSISNYACFANNPILCSDVMGDTITDRKGRNVEVSRDDNGKLQFKFDAKASQKDKAHFMANAGQILGAINETELGKEDVDFLNTASTKFKFTFRNRHGNELGRAHNTGAMRLFNYNKKTGLYRKSHIVLYKDRNSNEDGSINIQSASATMTVEVGHNQKEAIDIKRQYGYSPFPEDPAFMQTYQPLLNRFTNSMIQYKIERGLQITSDDFIMYEAFKEYGLRLDSNNQKYYDELQKQSK